MKAIRKASVFAAVLLGVCASSARAQGDIIVKVPFPFVVGHDNSPPVNTPYARWSQAAR